MASPHSYRWSIGTDQAGSSYWTFAANPLDVAGMFPERSYSVINVLGGSPLLQYSANDTKLRSVKFDVLPGRTTTYSDFVVGEDEDDSESLLYLKKVDSDGALTTYWLNIPSATLRPYGWRDYEWIPIRVEDVILNPPALPGEPQWEAELRFRLVPLSEASFHFQLDFSPLDSSHTLITSKMTVVYVCDTTGPTYYDETDDAFDGGSPFPDFTVAEGDVVYAGATTKFYGLGFEMDTAETVEPDEEQGATAHQWQYWNGAWTAISDADDQTTGFIKDSTVAWGAISDWVSSDLASAVSGAPSTASCYWVRCVVGTVTTAWQINKMQRE